MPVSKFKRRALIGAITLVCAPVLGLAAIVAGLDAGCFRGALLAYVQKSSGRTITVAGPLRLHLLSLHPSLSARGLTIGNPPWTPAGVTAHIDALNVVFELPHGGRPGRIDSLAMQGTKLTLFRDAAGHANWQRRDPGKGKSGALSLIASLSAADVQVLLDDQRLHLQFDGTISVQGAERLDGPSALQIRGAGQLNGKRVAIELTGDALSTASYDHAYRFSLSEASGGSVLTVQGSLPKPFDVNFIDASFEASGPDLKDLYFLIGAGLINTGTYRLTGHCSRSGTETRFTRLHLTSGQSDVSGTLTVDTSGIRTRSNATLRAPLLHAADFGLRAAGRETSPRTLFFSNAALSSVTVRRADGTVDFQAHRLAVGRQWLQDVDFKLGFERGVVTVEPLSAHFLGGELGGRVTLDATQDPPSADVDLSIVGLQLAQLPRNSADPPIEGALRARLAIIGRGNSAHEVAASAEGRATVTLPQGKVRAALVELAGLDLRGLGLKLANSKRDTQIRCASADLRAHEGVFSVQHLVMDTAPVRIRGEGSIRMDTETLDLLVRGEPKSPRLLRWKAPLRIRGTLLHPSFGIETGDAKLMLLDRGDPTDEECAASAPTGLAEREEAGPDRDPSLSSNKPMTSRQ